MSSIKLCPTATKFALSPTLAANELARSRRAKGLPVLQMGFGESPFPVPAFLEQALQEASHRKDYLPCAGDSGLREAALKYYDAMLPNTNILRDYEVIVAPGSKLILYSLQMAIEGDLLVPVPSWVSYGPQALMLKTNKIEVPTTLDDSGLRIDANELKRIIVKARTEQGLNPTKIILNSPNNPTGQKIPLEDLKAIAAVCREENIFIISDEIYSQIDYESELRNLNAAQQQSQELSPANNLPYADSISQFAPEITAISTGLSKHLSLGGWRIGFGLIPKSIPNLHKFLCNIASETWSCAPSPIQQAAVLALNLKCSKLQEHIHLCTEVHACVNGYIQRNLRSLGIHAPLVTGSFYNYPNFAPFREQLQQKFSVHTSEDLTALLAKEYGLIALPGVAFGAQPTELTMRLSSCDYDGAAALEAARNFHQQQQLKTKKTKLFFQEEAAAFVKAHAPNVVLQVDAFADLVRKLKEENNA